MDTTPKPHKAGKEYEQIVAAIHRQFAGDAKVTENEMITGVRSRKPRQIDVAIRTMVDGAYPILIILECKDYQKPVGIDQVDELIGKVDDVQAVMGVLVSNSGFTEDAKSRAAQDVRIQLASVVDVENEKVRTKVAIPIICDYRAPQLKMSISTSGKRQFVIDAAFMANLKRRFLEKWNDGKLQDELGEHQYLEAVRDEADLKVSVTYDYQVTRRLFFRRVKLVQTRGILNVSKGTFQTSGFTMEPIDAADVERNWERVDEANIPLYVIWLIALDTFPLPEIPAAPGHTAPEAST